MYPEQICLVNPGADTGFRKGGAVRVTEAYIPLQRKIMVSFALGDANFLCWPCTFLFLCVQGCQFSDFSLISDFLRIKESGIKLIKSSENMDTISIVFKDRLDSGKGLDNLSLNTVSNHLNQFRLSSD